MDKLVNLDSYTKVLLTFNNNTTEDLCGNTWSAYNNPIINTTNAYDNGGSLGGSSYDKFIGTIDNFSISNTARWTSDFDISSIYMGG